MIDKEKLNAILRLRLLFSTEDELGDHIDHKLKSNHFNKFKGFQCEAYYIKLAQECREYTNGKMDLDTLLDEYEATSLFYQRYIENTIHEKRKAFIHPLLERIFLGESRQAAIRPKDLLLCNRYIQEHERSGLLNIAILMLLTHGLLPTFKNKASQDVKDIVADYQRAYDILQGIAASYQQDAIMVCREMLCLKEMRLLIEEEREGDRYINRLLLIHIVGDVLGRIFALLNPARQMEYAKEMKAMDLQLPRFWRDKSDPENIVWEFEPLDIEAFYVYRKRIDTTAGKIHSTRYQLKFNACGYKEFAYTIIMRPAFVYCNILKRQQPDDALTFDYTELEYSKRDCREVKSMTFTKESPLGGKPMTLTPVSRPSLLRYYEEVVGNKGKRFTEVDDFPEYAVDMVQVEVAVSDLYILFQLGDTAYKLYKFYDDGTETIPGIDALTHKDNYVLATLRDGGRERRFLCLDSINQNLDLSSLLQQPYFTPSSY